MEATYVIAFRAAELEWWNEAQADGGCPLAELTAVMFLLQCLNEKRLAMAAGHELGGRMPPRLESLSAPSRGRT